MKKAITSVSESLCIDLSQNLTLDVCKEYIDASNKALIEVHRGSFSGLDLVRWHTSIIDNLITNLFIKIEEDYFKRFGRIDQRSSIIAIGGYGRYELCPFSDIDLIFLYPLKLNSYIETITEKMLYLLWDCGMDVGYSTRNIKDCIEIARSDHTVKTSILDSRYLIGDEELFKRYKEEVFNELFYRDTELFIKEKVEERDERYRKYGHSVYLLEPNVKEGEGGLRDVHTVLWLTKVLFKVDELYGLRKDNIILGRDMNNFIRSWDSLLKIRNELHLISSRKDDHLTFGVQEEVAKSLGFKNTRNSLGVEQFMQFYYSNATNIKRISDDVLSHLYYDRLDLKRDRQSARIAKLDPGFKIIKGSLSITVPEIFKKNPVNLMRIFKYSQKYNLDIDSQTKQKINSNLWRVDDNFRRNKDVNELFFSILCGYHAVFTTLQKMHEVKFLAKYIPEFGRLFCKTQHDLYHVYTVDVHSIFAIGELEKLRRGEYGVKFSLLTDIINTVKDIKILYLTTLLHDIGKGLGKGHIKKGIKLIYQVGERMGLSSDEKEKIRFLIQNHLVFPHIAQRRDLHDDRLIIRFAEIVGNIENLKMLYLLTFADIRAVGPNVWTEWKRSLFQELYLKTFSVLEKGVSGEGDIKRVSMITKKAKEILLEEYSKKEIEKYLISFMPRYFLYNTVGSIIRHFKLSRQLGHKTVVLHRMDFPHKGYNEIIICTRDKPGLISRVAGVFSANNVNILGAQINVRNNGKVLDIYQVNDVNGNIIYDEDRWRKVEKDLEDVLRDRVSVKKLLSPKEMPSILDRKNISKIPNNVEIDNEISDDYTVIDVYTYDRPGLLYRLTKTISNLGLDIHIAKISTKVDQVGDVFYVRDKGGKKIENKEILKKIKRDLMDVVEEKR